MTPSYLNAPGMDEVRPAAPEANMPPSIRVQVGGENKELPVSYWWKDAIGAGVYTHPKTNQRIIVDNGRIDRWVETFKRMRAAGIDIPAPAVHSDDARHNLGFIIDAKRVGNRLRILTQAIGDDGALTAARNRCSIYIDPDYTDPQGRHWGDCFLHSAFTPMPVVSGMGEFLPFAASDGRPPAPVYQLSDRSTVMDLTKLRAKLNAGPDVSDEALIDLADKQLGELTAAKDKAEADKAAALSRGVELEKKVSALSAGPKQPDELTLAMAMDTLETKRSVALSTGGIDKGTADKLDKLFLDGDKPSPVALSMCAGSPKPLASRVYEILAENRPIRVGERTGQQTHELSRGTPPGVGDDNPEAKPTSEERKRELLSQTPLGQAALSGSKN